MKRVFYLALLIFCSLFLHSCSEEADCDCGNPLDLEPLSSAEEQVVNSANDFAFDIFSRINQVDRDANIFLSPFSISTALSMTANGAVGETLDGIKKTLRQDHLSIQEVNESYEKLSTFIADLDPKVNLKLANSTWYKQNLEVNHKFKKVLSSYYNAEVHAADFSNPGTKELINGWIEDKTNGKIPDMIDEIPASIVMYLINAIYLKAIWQFQFDKSKTSKMEFDLGNGQKLPVDMMYCDGLNANFFSNDELQFIEVPYGNGQFVFSILLPNNPKSLDELINTMSIEQLNNYIQSADTSTFKLYLPKFKIKYKITLNELLADMGMEQSFGVNANLPNLFVEDLDLYISRVLHQSFIEVDEEGTEAAAATVVEIVKTSIGPDSKPSTLFIDKPFAFFIREKHSNAVIFSGKMINPTR